MLEITFKDQKFITKSTSFGMTMNCSNEEKNNTEGKNASGLDLITLRNGQ